jgi:hypothetical protein
MAILKLPTRDSVSPKIIPLTPLNLYLERVKSISEKLRADWDNLEYYPLQFGGIQGQQESLLANATVKIIDFRVTDSEQ